MFSKLILLTPKVGVLQTSFALSTLSHEDQKPHPHFGPDGSPLPYKDCDQVDCDLVDEYVFVEEKLDQTFDTGFELLNQVSENTMAIYDISSTYMLVKFRELSRMKPEEIGTLLMNRNIIHAVVLASSFILSTLGCFLFLFAPLYSPKTKMKVRRSSLSGGGKRKSIATDGTVGPRDTKTKSRRSSVVKAGSVGRHSAAMPELREHYLELYPNIEPDTITAVEEYEDDDLTYPYHSDEDILDIVDREETAPFGDTVQEEHLDSDYVDGSEVVNEEPLNYEMSPPRTRSGRLRR